MTPTTGLLFVVGCLSVTLQLGCSDPTTTAPPAPVEWVIVDPPSRFMHVGETHAFTAELRDLEGKVLTDRVIRWATNKTSVLTVDDNGKVTAHAPGDARITATSGDVTGSANIVVHGPVTAINITSPAPPILVVGQTLQLEATARDQQGATLARPIAWSSSQVSVATVSPSGAVTALAPGAVRIVAQADGVAGMIDITVGVFSGAVASVSISTPIQVMGVGSTHQATALVRDAIGNVLHDKTVNWTSSNPAVASIEQDGLTTMLGVGAVFLRAQVETIQASRQLFGMPVMQNNVPITISGDAFDQGFIGINVPAGATRLTVTLRGGTGDPALYVHAPITELDLPGELCGSQSFSSTTETCIIRNPPPGLWLIEFYGWGKFANVQLKAVVDGNTSALQLDAVNAPASGATPIALPVDATRKLARDATRVRSH